MAKYQCYLFECVLGIGSHSMTLHSLVRASVCAVGVGVKMTKVVPLVEDDMVQDRENVQ